MEIATSPQHPASTPWWRLVALVVVLAPVSALVLLPVGLGLQRYVASGDAMDGDRPGGIPRGAVVLEREVPADDLRPGDVISFRPPPSSGVDRMVTRRVVSIGPGGIVTRGDALPAADPWRLRPGGDPVPRVVMVVPWVGYAYLVVSDPLVWLVVLGSAAAVGLLATRTGRRARDAPAPRAGPVTALGRGTQP